MKMYFERGGGAVEGRRSKTAEIKFLCSDFRFCSMVRQVIMIYDQICRFDVFAIMNNEYTGGQNTWVAWQGG
jgi:hypothetical protein